MKLFLLVVGVIIFFGSVRNFTEAGSYSQNGRLRVDDLKLVNQSGYPIQLRGLSTHGLQWYGWGDCINENSMDALVNNWGADIIRISMYADEGGYKTNPAYFRNMVDTIVNEALDRDIYALIDWHMLDPGDPGDNIVFAKEFFTYMARTHGQKGHVLYEIANEPSGVSWDRIKSYAEEIIPIIRTYDSEGIIFVGTPDWSSLGMSGGSSPSVVWNNPLAGSNAYNVMYTFHFYAASHGESYRSGVRQTADRLPLFVTEWGSQIYTGDGANDIQSSRAWIDLMAEKKISWIYWNYSDDWRSGPVFAINTCPNGPWTGNSLKESGRLVMNWLNNPADDFGLTPTPTSTPTSTPTPVPGKKGDINNDSRVDVIDLGILLSNWNSTSRPPADINQDGRVDVVDLGILLSNWG